MARTMQPITTTLEDVLEQTVQRVSRGRTAATARRHRRVLAHLRLFLALVDVRTPLGLQVAARLEVARDLGREDAFARVLGIHELIACLPLFLQREWLAVRTAERRSQIRFVAELLDVVQELPDLPARTRVRSLDQAREAVVRARREPCA